MTLSQCLCKINATAQRGGDNLLPLIWIFFNGIPHLFPAAGCQWMIRTPAITVAVFSFAMPEEIDKGCHGSE
jgi:hypothetical protein